MVDPRWGGGTVTVSTTVMATVSVGHRVLGGTGVLYFGSERTNFVTAVLALSGGLPASVWWSVRSGSVVKGPLLWCLARSGLRTSISLLAVAHLIFMATVLRSSVLAFFFGGFCFSVFAGSCLDRAHVLSRSTHVRKEKQMAVRLPAVLVFTYGTPAAAIFVMGFTVMTRSTGTVIYVLSVLCVG